MGRGIGGQRRLGGVVRDASRETVSPVGLVAVFGARVETVAAALRRHAEAVRLAVLKAVDGGRAAQRRERRGDKRRKARRGATRATEWRRPRPRRSRRLRQACCRRRLGGASGSGDGGGRRKEEFRQNNSLSQQTGSTQVRTGAC